MLMERDVKESSKMERSTDKVRRDFIYGFIHDSSFFLSISLLTFEAKYFDAGGVRYEGEYQGNKEGQKSNLTMN